MRRFTFRLQRILELRERTKEERFLELGAIASRCNAVSAEIERALSTRASVLRAPRDANLDASGALEAMRVTDAYGQRLASQATRLRRQLKALEKQRESAAERYSEAKRAFDALDNLKQRQREAHRVAARRAEYDALHELIARPADNGHSKDRLDGTL